MDLKDYLAISGKPGLYKTVAQSKTGVIVESLIDGKRLQAFASDKISSLGEISIYTDGDDMPVREVFRLMYEKKDEVKLPDLKGGDKDIRTYFETVVPQFDRDRFYISHMRKVISWFILLISKDITDFSAPAEETSPGEEKEDTPPAEPKDTE